MTTEEIKTAIAAIKSAKDDPEEAHSLEDGLYWDFIRYVALHGTETLMKKAHLVLSTKNIDFPRWMA